MYEDLSIGEFVDRDTLQLVRHFAHPKERVWAALIDREQVSTWFLPCTTLEAKAGGRYGFAPDGRRFGGKITEFDPPRRINFGGYMRFDLSDDKSGCRLVLTVKRNPDGWNPMGLAGFHGWLGRLQRIVDGVEAGEIERWASESGLWESLWLIYERQIRLQVAGGAQVIYRLHFAPNDPALGEEAVAVLNNLVRVLKESPDLKVGVDGFGDDPCTHEESIALCQKRIDAAVKHLQSAGIDASRVMIGFALGNYHFLVSRESEAGRAFNRRVELRPIY